MHAGKRRNPCGRSSEPAPQCWPVAPAMCLTTFAKPHGSTLYFGRRGVNLIGAANRSIACRRGAAVEALIRSIVLVKSQGAVHSHLSMLMRIRRE